MDWPDPQLTRIQASVLYALFLRQWDDPEGGLTYVEMLGHTGTEGLTLPMAKKTIRQLRDRSKPLVDSYTDYLTIHQKGRRPEIFRLHPQNAFTDADAAHYLVEMQRSLPKDRLVWQKSDFDILVMNELVEIYRLTPDEEKPFIAEYSVIVNTFIESVERGMSPIRDQIAEMVLRKLRTAYEFGYLAKEPTKEGRLHLSPRVLAEFHYLDKIADTSIDHPYSLT
ncbi:MAG TPA: hypothetical protein VH639_28890 [Bryobacteraceae bacterium]|jgi:hypothetical protein